MNSSFQKKIVSSYYKARRLSSRFVGCLDDYKSPVYSSYSLFPSRISSLIRATSPDLVHLHWVQGEFISIEQLASIRLPIVWTLHDAWPFTLNSKHHIMESALDPHQINLISNGFVSRIMAYRKSRAINQCNIHFVAPSEWMGLVAKTSKLGNSSVVRVIPNGIKLDTFRPIPVADRYILDDQQGSRHQLVLLISSLASIKDPIKGFDIFLDAIRILYERGYQITLVTLGTPSNITLPYAKVVELGFIAGPSELARIYNSVDVTCIPSRIETHSQTGCESIACGTPVAAFKLAGNTSIVSSGITGYLAQPYSAQSFAAAILQCRQLSGSNLTRKEIARYSKRWDIEAVSQAYISLYREILGRSAF